MVISQYIPIVSISIMWVKQWHKPSMTGKVYGIVLPTL